MKQVIIILAVIYAIEAFTDKEQWINFKNTHKKNYKNHIEEIDRFVIFQSNLRRIEIHNVKEEMGLSTFRMGVNQFADLTHEEFRNMLSLSKERKPKNNRKIDSLEEYVGEIPTEFDWRKNGAVTDVKDQGSCGSCWSFSAIGTVEAANFLKTGKLISLSEQNLVDCDTYSNGCSGGDMLDALDYVEKNGIMTEKDYPYKASDGTCKFNSSDVAVKIKSYNKIVSGDEDDLLKKVALVGPVSVGIDASWNFQLYSSGILDDTSCSNKENNLNHGVLAVGYGSRKGQEYWIVKNSWGSTWGIKGYIWMSKNKKNQCGIATDATIAIM